MTLAILSRVIPHRLLMPAPLETLYSRRWRNIVVRCLRRGLLKHLCRSKKLRHRRPKQATIRSEMRRQMMRTSASVPIRKTQGSLPKQKNQISPGPNSSRTERRPRRQSTSLRTWLSHSEVDQGQEQGSPRQVSISTGRPIASPPLSTLPCLMIGRVSWMWSSQSCLF